MDEQCRFDFGVGYKMCTAVCYSQFRSCILNLFAQLLFGELCRLTGASMRISTNDCVFTMSLRTKAKCFKYSTLVNPCDRLDGTWYTFILQMKKARLTEIKQLA